MSRRNVRGCDDADMAKDDVETLFAFNGTSMDRRIRQTKSGPGKARYTVSFKSEPLLIQTDPKVLGAGPAAAIRDHLKQAVAGITDSAAPATIKARLSAQKAVMTDEQWAMKRYSGGKLGTRAPARTDRLFNDSGRLVESIACGATKDGYTINVAGNRFDPTTLNGGEAALLRIMERLRELVPEWGDGAQLLDVLSVRRALKDATTNMLVKAQERTVELKKQQMAVVANQLMRLLRLVA
jgi:hypothetical protein